MKNTYKVLYHGIDFNVVDNSNVSIGSRRKELILDKNENYAFFKYNGYDGCTELASEKIAYEIAYVLGYNCARIELAVDSFGNLGILNYLFVDDNDDNKVHYDFSFYLDIKNSYDRKDKYTISSIKECLDSYNTELFIEFIRLMIFDSLIGEQDRHEQNWGIIYYKKLDKYNFSPFYDNGCCLMRELNDDKLSQFEKAPDSFDSYIKKSKTFIYQDGKRLKHFELINLLIEKFPDITIKEIERLSILDDFKILEIINLVPKNYLTDLHKKYIIEYIKRRRDILLEMIKKESELYE